MIIGALYDGQKKSDMAKQHYEEALRVNPEFAPAANNLAYILAESDQELDNALQLAKLAKEKLPEDPGVMDTVAGCITRRVYSTVPLWSLWKPGEDPR